MTGCRVGSGGDRRPPEPCVLANAGTRRAPPRSGARPLAPDRQAVVMGTSVSRVRGDGVYLHVVLDGPADRSALLLLHGVTASGRSYEWMPPSDVGGRRRV